MSNWNEGPGGQDGWQKPSTGANTFELKAMTLADMLDYTIRLFRKEWKPIVVLVALLSIPTVLVAILAGALYGAENFSFTAALNDPETTSTVDDAAFFGGSLLVIVGSFIDLLVSVLVGPLVVAAITRLAAARYLGKPIGGKEAIKAVLPLWLTLIGATILTSIIVGASFVLCLIPALFMGPLLIAVVPAVVVEETSASNALSRSFNLIKKDLWRYILTVVLAFVVGMAIFFMVQSVVWIGQELLAAAASAVGVDPLFGALAGLVGALGSILQSVVFVALYAIFATLIYFDARVRFEGFDIQMMTARFGGNSPRGPQGQGPSAPQGPQPPSAPETGNPKPPQSGPDLPDSNNF